MSRIHPLTLIRFHSLRSRLAGVSSPAATLLDAVGTLAELPTHQFLLHRRTRWLRRLQQTVLESADLGQAGTKLLPQGWEAELLGFVEGWCPRADYVGIVLDAACDALEPTTGDHRG